MKDAKSFINLRGFLSGRFKLPGDIPASERSAILGQIQGRTSAVVNLFLTVLKLVLAFLSGSIAMLADALNNLGDIAGSLVLIFGYRLSQKPRDRDHPYGHGRLRTVSGLVLAIILVVVGFEAGKSGLMRIVNPAAIDVSTGMLLAIAITILVKAWLALFSSGIARATGDAALASEAWNHFFDILSTALVLLAFASAHYGLPHLDGYAAILISAFIIWTGVRYALETTGILLGQAPSQERIDEIHAIANEVPGVEGVHDVQIHEYGNRRLVTLHVELDSGMSALECHHLTEKVEDCVGRECDAKVIVHGDPVDVSHPDYVDVSAALKKFIQRETDFVGFHDLRINHGRPRLDIEVDLVVDRRVSRKRFEQKGRELKAYLESGLGDVFRVDIGVESEYSSDPEYRVTFNS